ncbi:MAG: aminoacetone oxidase family FAD-binding enzyme [bacterium]
MENLEKSPQIWDVAVIGGGPAGMMAAGRAAELGARVILLEKNTTLGKKLLITGGGRSNITNAQYDVRTFLQKYNRKDVQNDKFLFSAFSQFAVKDAIDYFHVHAMPTKVEAENRVFPISNSAQSVWDVLVEQMKKYAVHVKSNSPVTGFEMENGKIIAAEIGKGKSQQKIYAKKFIVATGGTSRPETGSTGDAFAWLTKLGHIVTSPTDALVPLAISDSWVKKLSGLALQNIKLTTFQNNQKQESHKGKILFTHFGVSGPTVLNMSKDISELLKYGEVELRLDLLPDLAHDTLNTRLQELFKTDDKKKTKNALDAVIPAGLVEAALVIAKIDPEKQNNAVTCEERIRLIDVIKGMPMQVSGLLGADKAIVSSGGVELTEVDFKTMQSRIVPNLYLVGDILNIDRPSGGYSLQLCWTTGFVAGSACVSNS